jgi:hypothetical protein
MSRPKEVRQLEIDFTGQVLAELPPFPVPVPHGRGKPKKTQPKKAGRRGWPAVQKPQPEPQPPTVINVQIGHVGPVTNILPINAQNASLFGFSVWRITALTIVLGTGILGGDASLDVKKCAPLAPGRWGVTELCVFGR